MRFSYIKKREGHYYSFLLLSECRFYPAGNGDRLWTSIQILDGNNLFIHLGPLWIINV